MQNRCLQMKSLRKIYHIPESVFQILIGSFFILFFLIPNLSKAQNKVKVGEFIIEPPTLENLGFEWYIEGDVNRNATVKVEYRIAASAKEWKKGMPLLRIGGEHITRAGIDYTTPHMFAGSILDLNSNTS